MQEDLHLILLKCLVKEVLFGSKGHIGPYIVFIQYENERDCHYAYDGVRDPQAYLETAFRESLKPIYQYSYCHVLAELKSRFVIT